MSTPVLLIVLGLSNLAVLVLLIVLLVRRAPVQPSPTDPALAERLGRMTGEIQQAMADRLEAHRQGVGDRVEAKLNAFWGIVTAKLDHHQGQVGQSVQSLSSSLTSLQAHAQGRAEQEKRSAESLQRLEAIIAGSQSKGAAGENILEDALSRLPAEWQERNFRVGNKVVEFGVKLPDGRVLPIDSKWAATELLERFQVAEDPKERLDLKAAIESAVTAKAREVQKYLDPHLTTSFGVAAVPDAVYALASGAAAKAFHESRVVVISYGLFLPYLLLVFQTTLKASRGVDVETLGEHLRAAQEALRSLQKELEGRLGMSGAMR